MSPEPSWALALQGPHVVVHTDPARGLMRVQRLPLRFDGPEALQQTLDVLAETIDRFPHIRGGLLLDFRRGPADNTLAFEASFVPFLVLASRSFERAAGLVSRAVGKLQLQRYIRQGQIDNLQAFVNERLAMAFLE